MPAAEVFLPVLGYVKAELIVNCVVVGLVLLVVGLRVLGRLLGPGLGWDDYLIILSVVGWHWLPPTYRVIQLLRIV